MTRKLSLRVLVAEGRGVDVDEAYRRIDAYEPGGDVDKLVAAATEQSTVIDYLFAMLIERDRDFYPSKSGRPWAALVEARAALAPFAKEVADA